MAINLSDNIHVSAPKPVESKYLNITVPYTSVSQANSSILLGERHPGLTVNINCAEYWYQNGTADACLINKSLGGTVTGATNGLTLYGANIGLGGTVTGLTNIALSNGSSLTFTDNRSGSGQTGIVYGGNYSLNYGLRSLVDKQYVDTIATGLNVHAAAWVATTGSINISSAPAVIDGVTLMIGQRVLVKDQSVGVTGNTANGIYDFNGAGNPMTRSSDYDGTPSGEVSNGDLIPVTSGSTQNNTLWAQTALNPITVGVTPLIFSLFATVIDVVAGNGIDVTMIGGVHTVSVQLATNCGLAFCGTGLAINSNIAGTALSYSAGTLNVNAANCGSVGAIPVGYNVGNCLVVACSDIRTAVNAITGATNGLNVNSGKLVGLGGSLTGDTCVITNGFALALENNSGNTYVCVSENAVDIAATSGNIQGSMSFAPTSNFLGLGISDSAISHDTNLYLTSSDFCVAVNSTYCSTISMTTGNTIIISNTNPAFKGVQYSCNYDANFTVRSLPDVGWVTGHTSGITGTITGATNGLHVVGKDIVWGGTLTGNTVINVNSKSLCIWNAQSLDISAFGTGSSATFGNNNTSNTYLCGNNLAEICSPQVSINFSTSGLVYNTAGTPRGLQYGGNYRNTFCCNSIVDAAYVTGFTAAQSNIVNTYNVTGLTYTATTTNDFIGASGGTCIWLPASPNFGQRISVADIAGNALSSTIYVCCTNNHSIVGASYATINTDYGSITFIYNRKCFWSTAAFIN